MDNQRNQKGQFQKSKDNRKHYPIIGEIYNDYTVISDTVLLKSGDSHVHFHVQCKCGKEVFIRAGWLKNGQRKRCHSCQSKLQFEDSKKQGKRLGFAEKGHKGIGDITKTYVNGMKRNAKARNVLWDLSIEFLWELYEKQNRKCALTGLDIHITSETTHNSSRVNWDLMTASLDRKNSFIGYIENNVQWIHKKYNRFKNNYPQDEFISMCNLVAKHNKIN